MAKTQQNSIRGRDIVVIAVVLVVLSVGVGLVFFGNQKEKSDGARTHSSAGHQNASHQSDGRFEFKELGVAITLPEELKGMTYETQTLDAAEGKPVIMYVTTPQFSELAAKCLAHDPVTDHHSFRSIQKKTGTFGSDGFTGENLKQFDDFYIAGTETSFECEYASFAEEFKQLGEKLDAALVKAFANAEKL